MSYIRLLTKYSNSEERSVDCVVLDDGYSEILPRYGSSGYESVYYIEKATPVMTPAYSTTFPGALRLYNESQNLVITEGNYTSIFFGDDSSDITILADASKYSSTNFYKSLQQANYHVNGVFNVIENYYLPSLFQQRSITINCGLGISYLPDKVDSSYLIDFSKVSLLPYGRVVSFSRGDNIGIAIMESGTTESDIKRAFGWEDSDDFTIDNEYGAGFLYFTGTSKFPDVKISVTAGEIEPSEPYFPGGTSGPSGGGGSYGQDDTSQPTIDGVPSGSVEGSASSTGMYTRYLVNSSWLEIFGDWLWTTDLGLAVAKSVISLIYGDPAESVISLMSFPFNLSSIQGLSTRSQNFFWGHHDAGFQATAITSSAITIDWGTISLSEYWGNFLDYTPHTKIEMYLPWGTGFVSIDPGECLPGTLQVITNIDLSKGSCVHNIIGNGGTVIASYAGQCAKQIPILSSDMASKMAGMVTVAAAGIVTGAAGAVGVGAGAVYGAKMGHGYENIGGSRYVFMTRGERAVFHGAEQAVSNVHQVGRVAGRIATSSLAINRSPTHVSRNGGFTDGSASLGVQYPYIIISRPSQSVPNEYGHHYGYPSNIFAELSSLKGYTEVGEIHLNGIPATDSELTELDEILKGGVIL